MSNVRPHMATPPQTSNPVLTTATVFVTKLAAAERQLRAAIRLYFAEEEELAVHTVAAAAYKLLADLKAERGMDEAADAWFATVFYAVRDFRRGTLSPHLTSNPEFMEWVRQMAEALPISADTYPHEAKATASPKAARLYWNRRNKVANFLKHADVDAGTALSLDEVDNLTLLMQGYSAYIDLTQSFLGNEGMVLQLYLDATHPSDVTSDAVREELLAKMVGLDEVDRRRLCYSVIQGLNEEEARNGAA
jgi:hypothetical protein